MQAKNQTNPPDQKENPLEIAVESLRLWTVYEAQHLVTHRKLVAQLQDAIIDMASFANISFAIKLSAIRLQYCLDNITEIQKQIKKALPVDQSGNPDFETLTKYLQPKNQGVLPPASIQ